MMKSIERHVWNLNWLIWLFLEVTVDLVELLHLLNKDC
jgi:hypothetical protein